MVFLFYRKYLNLAYASSPDSLGIIQLWYVKFQIIRF